MADFQPPSEFLCVDCIRLKHLEDLMAIKKPDELTIIKIQALREMK